MVSGSSGMSGMIHGTPPDSAMACTYRWLITQQRGSSSGIASRVCVVMPMIGRDADKTVSPWRRVALLTIYSFSRLFDQLVDHVFQVPGALVRRQLAIGARAVGQNRVRVFYLGARPQVVHHVVDEPTHQLTNEIRRRQLLVLAEIDELAAQAVADGAPLVLLEQRPRVRAKREVVAAQLPELRDDRLQDRGHAHGLVDARTHVADAELERRIAPVRPYVPPDLGPVGDA